MTKRRLHLLRVNGFKTVATHGARDREIAILEPWQCEPIDRTIPHVVSIGRRAEYPDARVVCTCGLDRGWQSLFASELDADWHSRHAEEIEGQACPSSGFAL
jgi:hypothetical protein